MPKEKEKLEEPKLVGHIPIGDGPCKACGLEPDPDAEQSFPHEPCPNQGDAQILVEKNYAALPASEEEYEAWIANAKEMMS